ncbi:hypothetical protein JXB11_00730 [Candidatus Woesearchaeota archaeon]|nr:hypothetical protein [Candidatus Woesearchaeota archaeon]
MKFRLSLEGVYLLLILAMILFAGPGILFNKSLTHSTPQGFLASDSYWHYSLAQYVREQGKYDLMPPSMVAGYEDVVGFNPPMLYTTTASLSILSGIEVHDAIQIMGFLFTLLAIFAMYFIVRRVNRKVALMALPLTLLVYVSPFNTAFLVGQWHFLTGVAFIAGAVMVVASLGIGKGWPLLAIMLMGLVNSHTAEFYYFVGFLLALFAVRLFLRQLKMGEVKKTALAYAIGIAASFYYGIIFLNTYQKYNSIELFKVTTSVANFTNIHFSDFSWLQFFLFAGIALNLFFIVRKLISKQPFGAAYLFPLAMLVVGLSNYFFLDYHAFQVRFMWPIYLAPLFVYPLYQLMASFKLKSAVFAYAGSFIIMIVVFFGFAGLNGMQMQISPEYWNQVQWIKQNTAENARVLYLPGDLHSGAFVWPQQRVPYIAAVDSYDEFASNGSVKQDYTVYISSASDSKYAYRGGLFSYGYHGIEENLTVSRDICDYDYLVIDGASREPIIAQYNIALAERLFRAGAEQVFANGKGVVVRNAGGDCLG